MQLPPPLFSSPPRSGFPLPSDPTCAPTPLSLSGFEKNKLQADSYTFATLSLFGGILFYKGIDLLVHRLDGSAGDHNVDIDLFDLDEVSDSGVPCNNCPAGAKANNVDASKKGTRAVTGTGSNGSSSDAATRKSDGSGGVILAPSGVESSTAPGGRSHSGRDLPIPHPQFPHRHDVVVELNSGHNSVRPSADLHTLHLRMAGKVHQSAASPVSALTPDRNGSTAAVGANPGDLENGQPQQQQQQGGTSNGDAAVTPPRDEKLVRMGLMTAVAIGIHNFPEGLATFVATLADPSVGFALAVAIAIHNIPEGLCVAIPVYYATGNRWKSFGWALLSGVSEPIGAGLGWLILKDVMSELVYGILFGVVAGMMINITIHELIPTAVRYDPADKVTTNSIILGMAIMALSLTLFVY